MKKQLKDKKALAREIKNMENREHIGTVPHVCVFCNKTIEAGKPYWGDSKRADRIGCPTCVLIHSAMLW